MPHPPRTSILLPVFNAVETLPTCLRSIQRQTDPDWECIVVDDGSFDRGSDIAREFSAMDPRFRLFDRPHRGLVPTLIDGVEHCRGRLVARMDADDWMHRDRIAAQSAALEGNPALAAVGCRVRLFPRSDLRDGMRAYEHWLNSIDSPQKIRAEAFVECPIAHPSLMIRSEILRAHPYRDCGWAEDYDLVLRLLTAGLELDVVPRRLLAWRDRPERLSRTSETYSIQRFTACKAAHLANSFLENSNTYALWGYGGTGRSLQNALRKHGKRPSAILELHPGRIGNAIAGAPVVHPDEWLRSPQQRLVVSVAGATARAEIRAALDRAGLCDGVDYVCAA
ncbi:MAG: glycosyltransferase [Deltaproteobacteria bacterium]|nr:glycosyltransferase [Deltaproteobacteria bacterium]MBW2577676.1 glycosyltransferase [Deltaproteobacteria bacterium]MBW2692041.1 glycosyltransferase [Deltaproteobacteria bacterium]